MATTSPTNVIGHRMLVEEILSSFDFPARADVDALWAREAEDRIEAYERGELKARPANEVVEGIGRPRRP